MDLQGEAKGESIAPITERLGKGKHDWLELKCDCTDVTQVNNNTL